MNGLTRFLLSLSASSETTAEGTGSAKSAGKEDPVELDSILIL